MAFTLDPAKQRLGLDPADTSQDARLQAEMATALALAERYTGRGFAFASQVEELHFRTPGSIQLTRFPIDAVDNLVIDGSPETVPSSSIKVDAERGLIRFDAARPAREITVDYTGGFVTMPADLEAACWMIFDAVHSQASEVTKTDTGAISSVTLTGVGTVRFENQREDATTAASLVPPRAATILDLFALPGA